MTINRYCAFFSILAITTKPIPDAVPPEVREWLASTFTRQLVTTRKRTEEKPKFRTVAHAIRAGKWEFSSYEHFTTTHNAKYCQLLGMLKFFGLKFKIYLFICYAHVGIFVDRIYRRVSSTAMLQFPPDVVKVLKVSWIALLFDKEATLCVATFSK